MTWAVHYHPDVPGDLRSLGKSEAAAVMKAIDSRIRKGQPDQTGKPLSGELAGCRRLRIGAIRIVYRVNARTGQVGILAVGPRRDDAVYLTAARRI